jgi:NAD(P)-dependent dehydrogenase (short-subunit alcohol dehydrogenase family)
MIRLDGKAALVTGGASGIGRGMGLELARRGADVCICDVDAPGGEETARRVRELGRKALFIRVDVRRSGEVRAAVQRAVSELGRIDILCNNAGISLIRNTVDLEESDWDAHLEVNLKGVFLFSREVARHMIERGQGGRIINTASYLGKIGAPGLAHYCASKFGVIGFTQSLAAELGCYRITVNAVCPGDVDTPMMDREWKSHAEKHGISPEQARRENEKRMLLGRLETPEDVARLVVFLASDEADYITAESINVSGGLPFTAYEG